MAIHYQDFKRFSKGQGYVGVACRIINPMADTKRFYACDCMACKLTLLNRRVVTTGGDDYGRVFEVYVDRVIIARPDGDLLTVNYRDFDANWGPVDDGEGA